MNVDIILTSFLNLEFFSRGMPNHQSATVLSGDEKPIWAPSRPTERASEDNTPTVENEDYYMPISWETQSIDTIVSNLRTDVAGYTFVLANFGGRVAGMSTWRFEVLSGSRSPSEVLSVSSEALLNLILLNYWKAWEAQTQADQTNDDSTQTSVVSSITEGSAATRYTKSKNGSTKDGWSVEGIRHFEDLMTKVEEDRNSENGKKFEKRFQQLMKERDAGGRKRRRPSATEQITSIRNDLSDASTSGDEGD
jgi:hypothetical protein